MQRSSIIWLVGVIFIVSCTLWIASDILVPLMLSFLFIYITEPTTSFLTNLNFNFKISRNLASLAVSLLFFICIAFFFIALGPIIYFQFIELAGKILAGGDKAIIKNISNAFTWLHHIIPEFTQDIEKNILDLSNTALTLFGKFLISVFQSSILATNIIITAIITPVTTFYITRDYNKIKNTFLNIVPKRHLRDCITIFHSINFVLKGFMQGQLLVCCIMSLYYSLCFIFLDLNYAIALGAISGILIFIPYVGAACTAILAIITGVLQFSIDNNFYILIAILIIGQILESLFISPKFVGDKIGLHPLLVILGLIVCGSSFGLFGIFFAMPILALIGVLVKFTVLKYKESAIFKD
ncbi:MAG: AI-2E family transporter [Proteobacteria bacterium]|nr:AI-2E family transporter [Pseudomonadota bacterium]